MKKNKKKCGFVTHLGPNNSDEALSFVILQLAGEITEECEIIFCDNKDKLDLLEKKSLWIINTGEINDPSRRRYDCRNEELSSVSRVLWSKFGKKICGSKEIADIVKIPTILEHSDTDYAKKDLTDIREICWGLNLDCPEYSGDDWMRKKWVVKRFMNQVNIMKIYIDASIKKAKSLDKIPAEKYLRHYLARYADGIDDYNWQMGIHNVGKWVGNETTSSIKTLWDAAQGYGGLSCYDSWIWENALKRAIIPPENKSMYHIYSIAEYNEDIWYEAIKSWTLIGEEVKRLELASKKNA